MNGSGEFKGTSISSNPASMRTSTIVSASSGLIPRNIAMSERFTFGQGICGVIGEETGCDMSELRSPDIDGGPA